MIQTVRHVLKGASELVLVSSGAAARARRRNPDRIAVLAYHNVVPAGATGRGDASLHLSLDDFRRQLDRLQTTHRIVGLETLGAGEPGARDPSARDQQFPQIEHEGVRAALTFDDAYRGALRHAVPELVARGLPATVFVCPGLLGSEGFWWDRVAAGADGLGTTRRAEALGRMEGRQRWVLEAFGSEDVPEDYRPADAGEVRELAGQPGMTLASHTWSHPNLTALGEEALAREFARARDWLAREAGEAFVPRHLTFPYGLWNTDVAAAARAAGHRFLWRVEGGLASIGAGGGVLPRVNVPAGASVRGFELRAAGVVG